jgi:cold shock CspA family protein
MPLTGTLRTWNDERGFGFIAPTHGGRELFVHVSAFPRDGSRPTVGETLNYELGDGRDGKPQAIRVYRTAIGRTPLTPRGNTTHASKSKSPLFKLVGLGLMFALGFLAYSKFQPVQSRPLPLAEAPATSKQEPYDITAGTEGQSRCDGRKYCSQMTSCTEAKYFLKNCPNVQMDGNHDGVPCEQQWCTSPFAK